MHPAHPSRGRGLTLGTALVAVLSACVYAPPMPQGSYPFDKHPGVYVETQWLYGYEGRMNTYLVNRSPGDKCAWTDYQGSRLLRAGDSWLVSEGPSPGALGVSNVVPGDPGCAKAKAGS